MSDLDLKRIAGQLRGRPPRAVAPIPGGRNNVVARADWDDATYLLKVYFQHPADHRDRLGAEYGMLSFLTDHGVTCVPHPVTSHRDPPAALYEFVEGRRLVAGEISRADVLQLAELLGTMWALKDKPDASQLPVASEAKFSIASYCAGVHSRVKRLVDTVTTGEAADFVGSEIVPTFKHVQEFAVLQAARGGLEPSAELPLSRRTLSPADHGFHNAIRRADGRLAFFDFEYAGWDDPAQVVANAVLLPELPLPEAFRADFVRDVMARFGADAALWRRFRAIYTLLAFKWCLIMMNEFLPVDGRRRAFAGERVDERRVAQLAKARHQLTAVRDALTDACWLDEVMRSEHAAGLN